MSSKEWWKKNESASAELELPSDLTVVLDDRNATQDLIEAQEIRDKKVLLYIAGLNQGASVINRASSLFTVDSVELDLSYI